MSNQLFYEDVTEGMQIPALVKTPTTRQLVKWAGASGDYNEIHYDKDTAQRQGLPGVIVHGWLTYSFLSQMITDWIGDGRLKKISASFRGIQLVGQDVVCKGTVIKKYIHENERLVECEIWAENVEGQRTTVGNATMALPLRNE